MLVIPQPTAPVFAILTTLAGGNNLVRQAQQNRLLKNPIWRGVLHVIRGGKPYTGQALVAGIVSENPLVSISQLGAGDALNLCQVIHKNRAYRNVYVGLFGGRTFAELIPVAPGGEAS
jgi:hypothetical protein